MCRVVYGSDTETGRVEKYFPVYAGERLYPKVSPFDNGDSPSVPVTPLRIGFREDVEDAPVRRGRG